VIFKDKNWWLFPGTVTNILSSNILALARDKGAAVIKLTVPVSERDHVIGNPDAPVTVVQYGDYESLNCRKTYQATERMIRVSLKKVRLVYRHFPLVHVHPHALRAAEAAEAAAVQGKFWEMHSLLYSNSRHLKDNDLHKYARRIGLNLESFDSDMARGVYVRQILKDRDLSIINGISGAPTFFVNDRLWAMTGVDLVGAVKDLAERSADTVPYSPH
jgi:formate-nitrite transporter family protein